MAIMGVVFAWNLRNPSSHPEANPGVQAGNNARGTYRSDRHSGAVREKLMRPATEQNRQYVGPDSTRHDAPALMCGQGQVRDEKLIASARLSGRSITFRYASNPDSGVLDRSFTASGNYLCAGGVCSTWTGTHFSGCTQYKIEGGVVRTQSVSTLVGCADPTSQGQLPSFFAGPWISQLLDYYRSINKPITNSRIEEGVDETLYYGGKATDCEGINRNPPQTRYLNNPYFMNDDAIFYYSTCDPIQDPTCRATKGVIDNQATGLAVCEIVRNVGPQYASDRICTPGQRIYPDGYNDSSIACFTGSNTFMNYSSYFWLECSSDGKRYILRGWGYWEGAPCGGASMFPPAPQVVYSFDPRQSFSSLEVGRLSVNRRRGGEAITDGDRVSSYDVQCVSSEPTPYRVWLSNIYNPTSRSSVITVRVDNAPGCNFFRFSQVSEVVGERIDSSCDEYEKQGCQKVNEWWIDANGRGYQVIRNGQVLVQATGCVEVVRNERNKTWTSSTQTQQSPPQNCEFPPKTCRTVGGTQECRQWWRIRREYKCQNQARRDYDMSDVDTMMRTLDWSETGGQMSFLYRSSSQSHFVGYGQESACEKYCTVKFSTGGRTSYEVLSCNGDTCPASGEQQVVESCRCGDQMRTGFGLATATLNAIYQALKDRTCN